MRTTVRFCSADEAVAAIPSGATVAVGGFVGAAHPEMLSAALEQRFLSTAEPRDLTLYYCAGQGDRAERGLNHLAHRGLLKSVIGGHWNLAPKLGALALANEIEAWNLPQGVLSILLREIAAKRPGVFSKAGLHTFIDPRHGGGKLNARTTKDLIEVVSFDGEEWLRYKSVPVHVALIRATHADAQGNLSMEREGIIGEVLPMAQAAKNHGGIVIAQVESVVDRIADPKAVQVPGILVDYVVVSDGKMHDQTFAETFNASYVVSNGTSELALMSESERKRIGARALEEIRPGDIVNLGIGLPEAVAAVAAENGRLNEFTLTVESGPIGGAPASGLSFGCSAYPNAIIDQPAQFDFYDGGGIDVSVLGAVEIDAQGSVNVASLGERFAGVGGFVNIAASAKRLIFTCTFRAGPHAKFVQQIKHVCFHGPSAFASGQQVRYVTERGVFELTGEGLRLIELAPGMDLQRDVLDQMEFTPQVAVAASTSSCSPHHKR